MTYASPIRIDRFDRGWALHGGRSWLPVTLAAAWASRDLLAGRLPEELTAGREQCSPGTEALVRQFVSFYFLGQGKLSKNVNYARLVLPPRHQVVASAPRSLSFLITKWCNLACLHCYNDSGASLPDELSTAERLELADYLGRWGVRVVTLTGGEPLLNRDAVPVMRILASHGVLMKVSTNGWRITEPVLDLVRDRAIFQVNVSLDGAKAETHDSYRQRKGSYARVMTSLAALQNSKVAILNLNVSIYDRNLADIDDICRIALQFGAKSVSLKPVLMSGRNDAPGHTFLSTAGLADFRRLRDRLQARYKGVLNFSGTIAGSSLPEDEADPVDCHAGTGAMFIGANGDLLPCELLAPHIPVPNARALAPAPVWLTHETFTSYRRLVADRRHKSADGVSGCPAAAFERAQMPTGRSLLPLVHVRTGPSA